MKYLKNIVCIFWFRNICFKLRLFKWFPIFKKAELQETKYTRKMEPIRMKFGKHLLLWTLITMAPTVFENFDFEGNFSQSIISRRWRLLESRMFLWTQILSAGSIFGPEHDGARVFPKFETFGKFRNKVWVPPFSVPQNPKMCQSFRNDCILRNLIYMVHVTRTIDKSLKKNILMRKLLILH